MQLTYGVLFTMVAFFAEIISSIYFWLIFVELSQFCWSFFLNIRVAEKVKIHHLKQFWIYILGALNKKYDLPLNKASSPKLNILYPLASFWVNNKFLRLLWGIKEQVMMHVCIAKSKLRFSFSDAYISAYFRLTNTKSVVIEHCIGTDMTQYMAKPD